jgi:very-short-patch-repair endonuclease
LWWVNSTAYSRALDSLLARQVRSFSFSELTAATSERALRVAERNGTVVRLLHGIYVAAEHQDSFAARAHAAARWAGPQGALSGEAALFAWGIAPSPPNVVEVALPCGTRRRPPAWIRPLYTTMLGETATWMSMPVARAEPALIACWGRLTPESREAMVFAGVSRGALSLAALRDAVGSTARMTARADLQRVLTAVARGDESHLEMLGSETVFGTAELQRLLRQHVIRAGGRRYRLDYYDPETRTAFELDGAAFHGALEQRTRDIARDATLAAIGVLTVRFGYWDVKDRPKWCRQIVIETLHSRRAP